MAGRPAPDFSATLLYVEDDEMTRTTVSGMLAKRFPELVIHTAANGAQGLQLFWELAPNLVVTDIKMPLMDGLEMSQRIMEIKAGVPIIVTSAHSDTDYLIRCIESGISRYLMKPIDSGKLFQAVENALAALRLERELQAQQAFVRKLSRALEQSPGGVVITDPQGVIEYVNQSFSALTGYRLADALGVNLRDLQQLGAESWEALADGLEWQGEQESVKKDGEPYSESISISPVFDEQGAISHLVAVKQDISERRRHAREIELLNQRLSARARELEDANRELEGFSYTVSHDLRSPLSTINGYCQALLELYGAGLDEQCRRFIDIIFNETVAMGELIGTLLDFSMVTRSELTCSTVDLSEVAALITGALRMREPGRCVQVEIAPGMSSEGDPALLRVVLDNLFANAWKYTGRTEQALIEFGVTGSGVESVYFVRDNGAGFDMKQASRLFHAFQRLHGDQEFKGFGVGLATVQRVLRRLGGTIWAEGEVGKGATFYFTLPPPGKTGANP